MTSRPAPKKRMRMSLVTLTKVIMTAQKAPWGYPLRMNHEKGFVERTSTGASKIDSSAWGRVGAGMEVMVFTLILGRKHFLFLQGFYQKVEKKGKVAHKLPISIRLLWRAFR
jgi:hypothetical protein